MHFTCDLCGMPARVRRGSIASRYICRECFGGLAFVVPPICRICGKRLPRGYLGTDPGVGADLGEATCPDCRGTRRFFKMARSVGVYDGLFKSAILALKYRGRRELARPFGALLAEKLLHSGEMLSVDVLVPVPLHPERLIARGYNQAELLAREVSRWTGLPILQEELVRTVCTPTQSRLPLVRRKVNPMGAFGVRTPGRVTGKRILLIDDILTTGATANECARSLLRAGSGEILVLTVVSGIIEKEFAPHS